MPRRWTSLATLAFLIASGPGLADGPPSKRVVEGRVVDAEGQPVRQGKVMFAPSAPGIGLMLRQEATATIDAEGRYRIELADFPPYGPKPLLASGPLKYLALSPGFKQSVGVVEADVGPSNVGVRLEPLPWKTTDLVLVDRLGKPAPDAEVEVAVMGVGPVWSKLRSDAEGRCRVEMAPEQPFGVTIRREGFPALRFTLRGSGDEPSGIKVTLREPIRGRVVDPEGKPVAGVRVGGWIAPGLMNQVGPEAAPKVRPFPGLAKVAITDEEGRYVLLPSLGINPSRVDASGEFRGPPLRLVFADESLGRMAFLDVNVDVPDAQPDATLRSTRPVSIPIGHALGVPAGSITIFWTLTPVAGPGRASSFLSGYQEAKKSGGGDRLEFRCPPGAYRVQANMQDMGKPPYPSLGAAEVELTVPEGEGPFEAPMARFADPARQRMVGRPAPEIEATDLDTGKPVTLAEFRGKVVVLDFWGYWCGPCVTTMPELAEVQRHFEGKPVVVLGLHDQSLQSREEYDQKLKGVKQALWGGKDLALRIALDHPDPGRDMDREAGANGITIRRYQVRGFPTLFLIDQEGRVAGLPHFRDHEGLKAMIQGLLDKPAPR